MTDAQKECMAKCEKLLGEHFDAYVIAVDESFVNDDNDTMIAGSWDGGWARAVGLCELQKAKIINSYIQSDDDE